MQTAGAICMLKNHYFLFRKMIEKRESHSSAIIFGLDVLIDNHFVQFLFATDQFRFALS